MALLVLCPVLVSIGGTTDRDLVSQPPLAPAPRSLLPYETVLRHYTPTHLCAHFGSRQGQKVDETLCCRRAESPGNSPRCSHSYTKGEEGFPASHSTGAYPAG